MKTKFRVPALLALVIALTAIQPFAFSQPDPGRQSPLGQFQLCVAGDGAFLLNTSTGQVWGAGEDGFSKIKSATSSKLPAGRFQIVACGGGAFLADTVTGQVWGAGEPGFSEAKVSAP